MAPQLRRPARSSGQPTPAGIDPSPLEVAEAERGQADDQLRERMAQEAHEGRAEGIAELPPAEFEDTYTGLLYQLASGQRRHSIVGTANVPIGGSNVVPMAEEVRAGMIFIVRAIRVQAPAGARLQIYQDQVTPTNFREVVTNVQEYSGEPPGTLVFRGPARIVSLITLTTAEGLAVVRLEGDLVKREAVET